ncbi:MAG: glycoside hydrolase family 43 protein [Planctomycetota bacterium]
MKVDERFRALVLSWLLGAALFFPLAAFAEFRPDAAQWLSTEGQHIDAHGGGVMLHEGVYYWYGERRNHEVKGIRCYRSEDLTTWEPLGVVLEAEATVGHDLQPGCKMERPKVIYNADTGKFVMWFHLELADMSYEAARTAVAVADDPAGPFTYLRSFRPHPGIMPVNRPVENVRGRHAWGRMIDAVEGDEEKNRLGRYLIRDLAVGQMARDMTVFQDDDGTAWHVHSAEENRTLHFARLTDDYLNFSGEYYRILPEGANEAPAIFKHEGRYYLIASGLTGWKPNKARSYVADRIQGPWEALGNPCVGGPNPHNGMGPELTFGGQSTFVLPVPDGEDGTTGYIAMFDVWQRPNLGESRYIWLPLTFEDGRPIVRWRDTWKLSELDE